MSRDLSNVPAPARTPAPARRPALAARDLRSTAGNRAIQRLVDAAVLQRACEECQAKHAPGQHEPLAAPDGFLSGKGSGDALGEPVRDFMESRFGHDFGHVRVHTDGHAARSAAAISAVAYTAGPDIFFAPGQYSPDTRAGQHLLAHELTHVIQQGGGAMEAQARLTVGEADDAYEREADQVANAVMAQGAPLASSAITPLGSPTLQRKKCVTGAFINDAEDLKLVEGKAPPTFRDAAWNAATGWYESQPFSLDAKFEPAEGQEQCANGEFHLFARGGGSRVAPVQPGKEAHEDPARLRVQAGPEEPALALHWKRYGRFLPDIEGHTASATIVPGIRAEAGGEKLEGVIEFRGQLIDRCADGNAFHATHLYPKTLAQISWFDRYDSKVPADWMQPAAQSGKQQPAEKKDEAPGKSAQTQPAADAKGEGRVRGAFTSVPSGTLRAVWDPQREFLGREFMAMAWFSPQGGALDCRHGEYRQFVQASWVRDLAYEGPHENQPKEVTKRLCEDKVDHETDAKKLRYGHRSDKNAHSNSIYGPDDPGWRYRSWDRPGMYAQPGEKISFKHVFIGQLIDTSRLDEEPPNSEPYKGNGVLDQSTWTIEGAYTRSGVLSPNQRQLEMSRRAALQSGQAGAAREQKAEVLGGKDNQGDSKAGKS